MKKNVTLVFAALVAAGGTAPRGEAAIINADGTGTLRATAVANCIGCTVTLNPSIQIFPDDALDWVESVSVPNFATPGASGGGGAIVTAAAVGAYDYDPLLNQFTGSGSVTLSGANACASLKGGSISCGLANSSGQADSVATFTLTTAYSYTVVGTVSKTSSTQNDTVSLAQQSGPTLFTFAGQGSSSQSGTLNPGTYYVSGSDVSAGAIPTGTESSYSYVDSFTYSLKLTPVPLPSAFWLLGSGLLGLGSISRLRKAA